MKKIFIFDAYSSNRDSLCEELASQGNMVMATGNSEIVRDSVERLKPDLIILDPYLGGELRWDLLLGLKALYRQTPIVIFSGCLPPDDLRVYFADAWVQKGIFFMELKQKISSLLEGCKETKAPRGNSFRTFNERMVS